MNAITRSLKSKSWVFSVTIMGLFLGVLLAMSLKGQQSVKRETGYEARDVPTLIASLRDAKSESSDLRKQNQELQRRISGIGSDGQASPVTKKALSEVLFWSGRTPAEGPGVVVTMKDSAGKIIGMEGIIHDSDIRNVVNELRAAGAEMISVNDQRLVGSSAIRCVGPVTLVNDVSVAPPYVIKAIGDPNTLEGALKMPRGVFESFTDPAMITIEQSKALVLKGYDGSTSMKFAKPVPAGET